MKDRTGKYIGAHRYAARNPVDQDMPEQQGELAKATVQEFSANFLDENKCREWLIRKLHREPRCPRCTARLTEKQTESYFRNERVKCGICKRYFTALTDTIFSGTRMSFKRIVYLLFLIGSGWNSLYIADCVGIDPSAVRFWRRRLKG